MTFTFLPGLMFCVNILTKESLSARDCSWKKPRACPTNKNKNSSYGTISVEISDQVRVDRGTAGIQLRERTRAPQVFILNTT